MSCSHGIYGLGVPLSRRFFYFSLRLTGSIKSICPEMPSSFQPLCASYTQFRCSSRQPPIFSSPSSRTRSFFRSSFSVFSYFTSIPAAKVPHTRNRSKANRKRSLPRPKIPRHIGSADYKRDSAFGHPHNVPQRPRNA